MKSETKNCQNCKKDFIIESEDFNFYEKIKVPPPTFCPHCRFVRRMIWRNERSLYKRKCDICQKNIISMYDDKVHFPVYCPECWWSDAWDPSEYNQEYDFSKNFLRQWQELFNKVPRQSLWKIGKNLNSEYSNYVKDVKNVYLSYSTLLGSEGVYFSSNIDNSKEIIDSYNIINSELLYQNIGSTKNYNCQYSYWSSSCIDSSFILDCINCQDCFGCVNLRNKNYCIWNKQFSREEYLIKIKNFNIGSYEFIQKFFTEFWDYSLKFPRKYGRLINCVNSNGDELLDSKNISYSFKGHDNHNIKYGYRITHAKDSMDVCHSWAELAYEHSSGGSENGSNV
jgi:hypothetical protein